MALVCHPVRYCGRYNDACGKISCLPALLPARPQCAAAAAAVPCKQRVSACNATLFAGVTLVLVLRLQSSQRWCWFCLPTNEPSPPALDDGLLYDLLARRRHPFDHAPFCLSLPWSLPGMLPPMILARISRACPPIIPRSTYVGKGESYKLINSSLSTIYGFLFRFSVLPH
jgi:hypothetical protein